MKSGVIYGLTAKPVAGRLGVAQPAPTGIGILGDDAWLVPFAEQLTGAGVDTTLITTTPIDAARPAAGDGGATLRTTSLTEGITDVEASVKEASLAQAVVSVDPDAALTLLEAALITRLGRRRVLRVPHKHHGGGGVVPTRWTAHAFRGEVTRVDIGNRFDAGATVLTITSPLPDDAFLLAAVVSPGGDVDLNPTTDTVSPGDSLIALVGAAGAPDAGAAAADAGPSATAPS